MKFRFTIAKKLIVGFSIITISILVISFLINRTLQKSIEVNNRISEIYVPSTNSLGELSDLITSSKMLIKNWVFIEKKENTPDKLKLIELHQKDYPEIHKKLFELSDSWSNEEQIKYLNLHRTIQDTLFKMHKDIMQSLNTFDAYNDPFLLFEITPKVEQDGEIITLTDHIIEELDALTREQQHNVDLAREEMEAQFSNLQYFVYMMAIILVIVSLLIAFFLSKTIIRPVIRIKDVLYKMSKGILPKKKIKAPRDEIGEMAGALNELVNGLKDTTEFSIEIGKGNFESKFTPLSEEDDLGNALLEMRKSLKNAKEEEAKRKKEDEQRNWASQGIAKFSDLLRQNNDDLEKLSYSIISNLVKYNSANQGGLFIMNEDDPENPFIELKACYAYDREKNLEKKVEHGVGLLGRAVKEGETIYLTDIPDDYIKITSGLGKENPKALLIVPLKLNEEVHGVIEMASFKPFEKYQIEFIEKICENLAATLSTVKINIRTNELLERTQQQAEEMKAQEEEMRQNMEELQATQEESQRREQELEKKVEEYEEMKKQQEKLIKKLAGGNLSGNLINGIDDDDDENE